MIQLLSPITSAPSTHKSNQIFLIQMFENSLISTMPMARTNPPTPEKILKNIATQISHVLSLLTNLQTQYGNHSWIRKAQFGFETRETTFRSSKARTSMLYIEKVKSNGWMSKFGSVKV